MTDAAHRQPAESHAAASPADPHLAGPHVADPHLADPHLADPHVGVPRHDVPPSLVASGERLALTEFDPEPQDVITAAIDHSRVQLPPRAVFTLLGATTPTWAAEHGYEQVTVIDTITMDFPVWVGRHHDVPVALLEVPLGAPAAVIVADHAFRHGVRAAIATGSCGGLVHVEEGEFIVPTRALRDEGTSFHYAPPSRWIELDPEMVDAAEQAVTRAGYGVRRAATWTTDAFYRETRGKIDARLAEGCTVVDMECSALAACARFRGARFGQILFSADTLAGDIHDVRGWGRATHATALQLALDAATSVAVDCTS